MGDMLIMSKRELERKSLLDGYLYKKLTLQEAAERMRVGYRQAKRLLKKYKEHQDSGLIHGNRGKTSPNAYDEKFKEDILNLYQTKYLEFGPTFAAEKMHEDDERVIHPETLRLWLKEKGLWIKQRKRKLHRQRRKRRESFGDLLQIDGSIHQWFTDSDEYSCLLNIVDDATGITLALLDKGETTYILLTTFMKWIERYGIPKSVYVDLKSVYVGAKHLKEKYDDDLLIKEGFSVFEQVCRELNIEIIKAYSAQAKGRVERKHAIFQDRLVKDLKLYGIKTQQQANNYLETKFLNHINRKFAKEVSTVKDFHRDPNCYGDLQQIFCWRYKRQLRNDWTIHFSRNYFQIENGYLDLIKPGEFVTLRKYLNGSIKMWFEGTELHYKKLIEKPESPSKSKRYRPLKGPADPALISRNSRKNKHRSPWSGNYSGWIASSKKPTCNIHLPENDENIKNGLSEP